MVISVLRSMHLFKLGYIISGQWLVVMATKSVPSYTLDDSSHYYDQLHLQFAPLHTRVSHRLPLGVLIKAKARLVFIVCRGEVLCVDGGVLKLHNECDTSRRHTCHVLLLTAQFGGRLRTRG